MKIGAHRIKPCGKYYDQSVYIHKDYAHLCDKIDMDIVNEYAKVLPKDFDYTIIRYDRSAKREYINISFINLINFDSADMPLVGDSYFVKGMGYIDIFKKFKRVRKTSIKKDPQIKIHKWLYVPKEYKGFDWDEAVEYSETLIDAIPKDTYAPQKLSEWVELLKKYVLPIEKWHDAYLPVVKKPKVKDVLTARITDFVSYISQFDYKIKVEDVKYRNKLDQLSYDSALASFNLVCGYIPSVDNEKDMRLLFKMKDGIIQVLKTGGI